MKLKPKFWRLEKQLRKFYAKFDAFLDKPELGFKLIKLFFVLGLALTIGLIITNHTDLAFVWGLAGATTNVTLVFYYFKTKNMIEWRILLTALLLFPIGFVSTIFVLTALLLTPIDKIVRKEKEEPHYERKRKIRDILNT
jgi:hypothetical protein